MPIAQEAARERSTAAGAGLARRVKHARDTANEIAFYAEHFDPGQRGSAYEDPNHEGAKAAQRWSAIQVDAEEISTELEKLLEQADELADQVKAARQLQRQEDGIA